MINLNTWSKKKVCLWALYAVSALWLLSMYVEVYTVQSVFNESVPVVGSIVSIEKKSIGKSDSPGSARYEVVFEYEFGSKGYTNNRVLYDGPVNVGADTTLKDIPSMGQEVTVWVPRSEPSKGYLLKTTQGFAQEFILWLVLAIVLFGVFHAHPRYLTIMWSASCLLITMFIVSYGFALYHGHQINAGRHWAGHIISAVSVIAIPILGYLIYKNYHPNSQTQQSDAN